MPGSFAQHDRWKQRNFALWARRIENKEGTLNIQSKLLSSLSSNVNERGVCGSLRLLPCLYDLNLHYPRLKASEASVLSGSRNRSRGCTAPRLDATMPGIARFTAQIIILGLLQTWKRKLYCCKTLAWALHNATLCDFMRIENDLSKGYKWEEKSRLAQFLDLLT